MDILFKRWFSVCSVQSCSYLLNYTVCLRYEITEITQSALLGCKHKLQMNIYECIKQMGKERKCFTLKHVKSEKQTYND